MKIAHILTYTYESGGTSKFALDTAEHQVKSGDDVLILSVHLDGHTDYPIPEGVELKRFAPEFKTRFFPLYSSKMLEYIQQHQHEIDVFHLHCLWNYGEWIIHKLNLHKKAVITIHGSLHPYTFKGSVYWKRLLFTKIFQKDFMKKVRVVHVLNEDEKQAVYKYTGGEPTQIEIIPNGIDLAFHENNPALKTERRQVLFLARLHHKKGLDLLMPAFKMVVSELPDVELILAGHDDGMLAFVNKFIHENQLQDNIRYIGSISGIEKTNYLKTAEVFVLPTYSEGFSLGILEALEYEIPVVCSNQTGLSPDIENYEAAVIVELTPESVAQGLLKVLTDDSLAQNLRNNGKLMIEERFEKNKICQAIDNRIYNIFRPKSDEGSFEHRLSPSV